MTPKMNKLVVQLGDEQTSHVKVTHNFGGRVHVEVYSGQYESLVVALVQRDANTVDIYHEHGEIYAPPVKTVFERLRALVRGPRLEGRTVRSPFPEGSWAIIRPV